MQYGIGTYRELSALCPVHGDVRDTSIRDASGKQLTQPQKPRGVTVGELFTVLNAAHVFDHEELPYETAVIIARKALQRVYQELAEEDAPAEDDDALDLLKRCLEGLQRLVEDITYEKGG
jgi:hypothetical protein